MADTDFVLPVEAMLTLTGGQWHETKTRIRTVSPVRVPNTKKYSGVFQR